MNKQFLAYVGAGCVAAIALSSLMSEIGRLYLGAWQFWLLVWGAGDLAVLAWFKYAEEKIGDRLPDYFAIWIAGNGLMVVGGICGQY